MAGGLVIVIAILICALGTHHLIPKLKLPPDNGPFTFRRLNEDFRDAFSNRAFLTLIVSILTASTAVGLTDALGLYVNTYFWEFTTQQLSLTVLGGLAGTVGAFVLTAPLTARFDKRSMALATLAVIVFVGPLPVLLRLVDLMPANGHPSLIWIIVAHVTIIVFVAVSIGIVVGSMIADTIDQNDLRTGKRQEGMFNAALGFTAKATSGLGGFVAGITLDLINFPTGAKPGEVPPETIYKLGLVVGPGILIFWLAALALMRNYRLTREDHRQVIFEINERDRKKADLDAAFE